MPSTFAKLYSAALKGVEALEVEIEANASPSEEMKGILIVGLPDAAVRESRDRVLTAIWNSGFQPPRGRLTVNLAPADVRKEGAGFDLPIALGLIAARLDAPDGMFDEYLITGELALDGGVRAVRGVLPLAIEARARGRRAVIVPRENAVEASVVDGVVVYGVTSLAEAYRHIDGTFPLPPEPRRDLERLRHEEVYDIDFADVKGQAGVKRALEVAVAGGHNLLMVGPPGTGKSMLAKRVATIMPAMSEDEAIEATKIHSIAGLLSSRQSFLTTRPFRSPHHTISDAGLLGGTSNPLPGEVSLAHNGVLFLDELPEFRRSTLEVMRQPLEDGKVTISRAAATITYPARFLLVAAMNPCPCGYFGDPKRECRCTPNQLRAYRQRLSGPLLDRIDIHIEVPSVDFRALNRADSGEASDTIRARIEAARAVQAGRFAREPNIRCNASMSSRVMKAHTSLDDHCRDLLENAMHQMNFSARAHDRILKVARTLADLAGHDTITSDHLLEAVNFRTLDRNLWV
ncbi:MAG: YifB family Mg chelatase-like AAA ATPase [Verrucomicrobiales bacterium]